MRYKIKINSQQKGFTIVEALIVLAVTGMLFVSTSMLIRGQIEKTRYQDSMRQLQQMVQNTIDDVENGYLIGDSGTSDTNLLVGKSFQFCVNNSFSGCPADATSEEMYTTTITQNINTGTKSFVQLSKTYLPGGLRFKESKQIIDNTTASYWNGEFTTSVLFTGVNNLTGRDIDRVNTIKLYDSSANKLLTSYVPNGFLLCFEGYKSGSLEFGSRKHGDTMYLNIEDARCN